MPPMMGGAGTKGGKHPRDVFVKGGKGGDGSKGGAFNKGGAGSKGGKHPRDEATMVHGEDAV
ncbi:hypothetical protein CF319_g9644, partial [Tilletia indica]